MSKQPKLNPGVTIVSSKIETDRRGQIEGEVGIDRIKLWLEGNALLVAPRRQWPESQ
jgi:hypothetical protein